MVVLGLRVCLLLWRLQCSVPPTVNSGLQSGRQTSLHCTDMFDQ